MSQKFHPIRKVAVLGAGVMGAQIAAHLANADVEVILYDLPAEGDEPNAVVKQALENLKTLKPSPISDLNRLELIQAANYDTDLQQLSNCQLIVEAIAERMDYKVELYKKIAPLLNDDTYLCSNTSGLSIQALAEILPESVRPQFCGVHFFNPPRYMHLVELIPHETSDSQTLESLESFLVSILGKGVIHAKDTPNFIANRVGVFSYLAIIHHAKEYGISFEIVDQLTGPMIGRPKSATFRTFDVIGLDTLINVIKTMEQGLQSDPWHAYFNVPEVIQQLVQQGALGQKNQKGFYQKKDGVIQVYDPVSDHYEPVGQQANPEVIDILKIIDVKERFSALKQSEHKQAQFLWACYRDLFHYVAYHLSEIADDARSVDLAMRWGFGWQEGPFETWQKAGWQSISTWLNNDISDGKSMSNIPLPEWASSDTFASAHNQNGSYSPKENNYMPRSFLPVYQRQYFPDSVIQEMPVEGKVVFESPDVRLWHLRDEVAVLSFNSKMGTIGQGVLDGIQQALAIAERQFKAMVIWQDRGHYFSVGANLKEVSELIENQQYSEIEQFIKHFQDTMMAVKYSVIPVVAAVRGFALGGGCELMLHCTQRIFSLETQSGLVELGVGLIPAGGGCKEIAKSTSANWTEQTLPPVLKNNLIALLSASISGSAEQLRYLGICRANDHIILNPHELLYVAQQNALTLAESNYRPLHNQMIRVVGEQGVKAITEQAEQEHSAGRISEYDLHLASTIANVLCGGQVAFGTLQTEQALLELERNAFVSLVQQPKTLERIQHMLTTGKRLTN